MGREMSHLLSDIVVFHPVIFSHKWMPGSGWKILFLLTVQTVVKLETFG